MIGGRESVVPGIRLLIVHRIFDGVYKAGAKGTRTVKKEKGAVSRITIASVKMLAFACVEK